MLILPNELSSGTFLHHLEEAIEMSDKAEVTESYRVPAMLMWWEEETLSGIG